MRPDSRRSGRPSPKPRPSCCQPPSQHYLTAAARGTDAHRTHRRCFLLVVDDGLPLLPAETQTGRVGNHVLPFLPFPPHGCVDGGGRAGANVLLLLLLLLAVVVVVVAVVWRGAAVVEVVGVVAGSHGPSV